MINVIDFDHGCGGLTAGLERYGEFITVDNLYLNQKNEKCYNGVHLNPFWTEAHVSEEDYDDLNIQLACFSPLFGKRLARRGGKKINLFELKSQFKWIKNFYPEVVLFAINPEVLSHLHLSPPNNIKRDVISTADNWPLFDKIVYFLHQNDYKNVAQLTINYLDYNIPQNKKILFYVGWNNDNTLKIYKPNLLRRKKIKDVLQPIPKNDIWHKPNFKYYDNCSHIRPGGRASNSDLPIKTGYIRLIYDKIAPNLSDTFYRVSDNRPSIHPVEHRPLTIREGARLNGLDDTFIWNDNISYSDVGQMIYNSVSPIVSYYIAQSIFELLM